MPGAARYAHFCRATHGPGARALRAGRPDRDRAPTSAKETCSTGAIAEFSSAYADQNERDYQAFAEAVASGRLIAHSSACSRLRGRVTE